MTTNWKAFKNGCISFQFIGESLRIYEGVSSGDSLKDNHLAAALKLKRRVHIYNVQQPEETWFFNNHPLRTAFSYFMMIKFVCLNMFLCHCQKEASAIQQSRIVIVESVTSLCHGHRSTSNKSNPGSFYLQVCGCLLDSQTEKEDMAHSSSRSKKASRSCTVGIERLVVSPVRTSEAASSALTLFFLEAI